MSWFIQPEQLRQMYEVHGLSTTEIAATIARERGYKCSSREVALLMKKHKIAKRTLIQARELRT